MIENNALEKRRVYRIDAISIENMVVLIEEVVTKMEYMRHA